MSLRIQVRPMKTRRLLDLILKTLWPIELEILNDGVIVKIARKKLKKLTVCVV